MNNKSLIFLAIKSLDIQNQTSLTSHDFNLDFNIQLSGFITNSSIRSDKDLQTIIVEVLQSISSQSLQSHELANTYRRRFRYYFKKMSFCKYLERSIHDSDTLIDKLGATGLYLLYLIVEKRGLFKLWLYYRNYRFEQLISLIETKNKF
uniref:Uncharacterized protein n=1 Tax=Wildemania schizophylla TaxID=1134705 RepID=A0A126G2A7_WILSC|nr:hypothetical protein [Wildemania schizophylla]AKS28495.1 hypothetical protein [Wildemania schizophylla]